MGRGLLISSVFFSCEDDMRRGKTRFESGGLLPGQTLAQARRARRAEEKGRGGSCRFCWPECVVNWQPVCLPTRADVQQPHSPHIAIPAQHESQMRPLKTPCSNSVSTCWHSVQGCARCFKFQTIAKWVVKRCTRQRGSHAERMGLHMDGT